MKLKIDNVDYPLRWSYGAFAEVIDRLGEQHDLVNEMDVILKFTNHKVYLETIYCALLVGKQVELDDDTYELPFSRAKLQAWFEEQPQEINTKIGEDFAKYTNHGKSWKDKIDEVVAKFNEMNKDDEDKKKEIKKKPSPRKKSNA